MRELRVLRETLYPSGKEQSVLSYFVLGLRRRKPVISIIISLGSMLESYTIRGTKLINVRSAVHTLRMQGR